MAAKVHWVRPSLLSATAGDAVTLLRLRSGRTDCAFLAPADSDEGSLKVDRTSACLPPLPPEAVAGSTLRRNRAGDVCLLVGPAGVWILQLPQSSVRTGLGSSPTSTAVLGGLAPAAVIDAQFHPLSDNHVIVLARDGLRAYDVRGGGTDAPCASWLFAPGALGASAPTAFAFGAARGWELFAVLVIAASGDLFYITPVLPPGVLLPAADWQELRGDLEAAAEAPGPVQGDFVEAARVSLRWLDSSFEEVPGQPSWRRHAPAEVDPLHGRFSGGRVVPALQGPVTFAPALSIPAEQPGLPPPPAVDVAVFPPAALEFTAVALAYGDGRVVSACCSGPLLPVWGRPQRRGAPASSDGLCVVLPRAAPGEQVPLFDGPAGQGTPAPRGVPWLVADAVHLSLGHPLAVANARVAAGGAAFAGGLPGEGFAGEGAPASAGAAALGDVVHVPRLLQVPSIPEAVVVVSRHAVHVLWAGWTHAVRRLLSGDPSALQEQQRPGGGRPPSQAFRLLHGERIDIVGASLAPRGGELLVWSLRADEAASGESATAGGGSGAWGAAGGGSVRVAAPGLLHRLSLFGGGSAALTGGGLVPEDGSDASAAGGAATRDANAEAAADKPFAELSAAFPVIARRAVDVAAQLAQEHAATAAGTGAPPSAALADSAEALKAALEPLLHARAVTHARARQLVASAAQCSSRSRALADDVGSLQASAQKSYDRLAALSAHADNLKARAEAVLFALALQSGQLSRAERAYGAEMDAIDDELTTQVAAGVARVQAVLDSLAPRASSGAAAAATPSLAALQRPAAGVGGGLDATAISALGQGLATTSGTVQRTLRKAAELRATLEGLQRDEDAEQVVRELGPAGYF